MLRNRERGTMLNSDWELVFLTLESYNLVLHFFSQSVQANTTIKQQLYLPIIFLFYHLECSYVFRPTLRRPPYHQHHHHYELFKNSRNCTTSVSLH
jgi:hypothetical protein